MDVLEIESEIGNFMHLVSDFQVVCLVYDDSNACVAAGHGFTFMHF